MKYIIIEEDILNKKLIISFDPKLPHTEINLPNEFFSTDGKQIIKSRMLDTRVWGAVS